MTAKPGTTSTADRILDAAIGLMNTKGYNPVSVREIAKAVGLSEMTVFRHFPSKYAMLMAAMRRAPYAEMIEDVFTTHVRWELEHDLRHFMRRYMDIAEQRIGIWRIYFSAIGQIDEHSTELVSDVTSFRERLRAYFEEMIRRGHIRQLDSLYVSSLFWNLIFGFVMTLVIGRKRPGLVRDEYIENAVSVFIGGIWLWYRTHCVLITNDSRIEGTLVSVASRLSDRVVQVMVNEGDTVHKGQGLVRIDSRSVMARKAKAEAALELAKARWEDAKAGFRRQEIMAAQAHLDQAQAMLERAGRDFRRMEQLARNDGGVTQADRDAASSAYRAAQANVAAAQEELALKKEGSRPEVIRAAEAQVMQAQAELDEINVLCQDSVIPSPVNGVVAQKLVSAGELVAAGQKLFTLVNTDDIWLNARIEETRIGQIRVGQDVAFTIDGYPGRTFSGRIYEINPAACSVFSLISTENVAGYFTKIMQRVPVKISLPRLDSPETDPGEPEVVFRIGMQGTIEIQL